MQFLYPRAPSTLLSLTEPSRGSLPPNGVSVERPVEHKPPPPPAEPTVWRQRGGFGAQTAPRTSVFNPAITVVDVHQPANLDSESNNSKYSKNFAFTGHGSVQPCSRAAQLNVFGRELPVAGADGVFVVRSDKDSTQGLLSEVLNPKWEVTKPAVPSARIGPSPETAYPPGSAPGDAQRRRKERLEQEKAERRERQAAQKAQKRRGAPVVGRSSADKRRKEDNDAVYDWSPYQWVTIAVEGGQATVPPDTRVRYGTSQSADCGNPLHEHNASCHWVTRVMSGVVYADSRFFGDPCPQSVAPKVLQCLKLTDVEDSPPSWKSALDGVDSIQSGSHTLNKKERPPWERWHLTALLETDAKQVLANNDDISGGDTASVGSGSHDSAADSASDADGEGGVSSVQRGMDQVLNAESSTRKGWNAGVVRMGTMMGRDDVRPLEPGHFKHACRSRKQAMNISTKQLKGEVVSCLRHMEHLLCALKDIRAVPDEDLKGDEISRVEEILFDARGYLRDSTPMLEVAGQRLDPNQPSQVSNDRNRRAEKTLDLVTPAKAAVAQIEQVASLLLKKLKRVLLSHAWRGKPVGKTKGKTAQESKPTPHSRWERDTIPITDAGLLSLGSRRVALDEVLRETRYVLDILARHTKAAKERQARLADRERSRKRALQYDRKRKREQEKRTEKKQHAAPHRLAPVDEEDEADVAHDGVDVDEDDADGIVRRMESRLMALEALNSRVQQIEDALPKAQYLLEMHEKASQEEQESARAGTGVLADDQKHNEMAGELLRQKLRQLHRQLGETVAAVMAIVKLIEKTRGPHATWSAVEKDTGATDRAFSALTHFAQHRGSSFAREDFETAQQKRAEAAEKKAQDDRLDEIMERARLSSAAVAEDLKRSHSQPQLSTSRRKGTSTFGRDKSARIGDWQPQKGEGDDDGSDAEDYHKLAVHSWHEAALAVTKPRAPSARIGPPVDKDVANGGKAEARRRIQARFSADVAENRPGPGSYDTHAATKHVQPRVKGGLMFGRPSSASNVKSGADTHLDSAYHKALIELDQEKHKAQKQKVKGVASMDRSKVITARADPRIAQARKRAEAKAAAKSREVQRRLSEKTERESDRQSERPQHIGWAAAGANEPTVQMKRKLLLERKAQEVAEERLAVKDLRSVVGVADANAPQASRTRDHIPGALIMKPPPDTKPPEPPADSVLAINYDAVRPRKPSFAFAPPKQQQSDEATRAAVRRRLQESKTERKAQEILLEAEKSSMRQTEQQVRKDAWSLQLESESKAQALRDERRAQDHSTISEATAAVPYSIGVEERGTLAFNTMGAERAPRHVFDFEEEEAQEGHHLQLQPSSKLVAPRVTGGHIAPLPKTESRLAGSQDNEAFVPLDLRTADAAVVARAPSHGFGNAGPSVGIEALRAQGLYQDDVTAEAGDYNTQNADGLVRPNPPRASLGTESRFKQPAIDDPLSALTTNLDKGVPYTSERRVPPRVLFGKHEDYAARGQDPMAYFEDYTEYDVAPSASNPHSALMPRVIGGGATDMSKAPVRFSSPKKPSPRLSELAPMPPGIGSVGDKAAGSAWSSSPDRWKQRNEPKARRQATSRNTRGTSASGHVDMSRGTGRGTAAASAVMDERDYTVDQMTSDLRGVSLGRQVGRTESRPETPPGSALNPDMSVVQPSAPTYVFGTERRFREQQQQQQQQQQQPSTAAGAKQHSTTGRSRLQANRRVQQKGTLKDALRSGATVVATFSSLVKARERPLSPSHQPPPMRVTVQRRPFGGDAHGDDEELNLDD